MTDHDRMHCILCCQLRIEVEIFPVRIGLQAFGSEDMAAGMNRAQSFQSSFEPVRKRLIGLSHAREHRIATMRRNLAGQQNGSEGGDVIVAVIGMPSPTDVGCLRRLLPDFCDLWIARRRLEKPIDVNGPHALGKGDMLFWREPLVPEEYDA